MTDTDNTIAPVTADAKETRTFEAPESTGRYSLRARSEPPAKPQATQQKRKSASKSESGEAKKPRKATSKKSKGKGKKAKGTKAAEEEEEEVEIEKEESEESEVSGGDKDKKAGDHKLPEEHNKELVQAEKKEHTAELHTHLHIIEKGQIYFFYRPRVEEDSASSEKDVQRLYVVLRPFEHEGIHPKNKLIIFGKKHLPNVPKREREWAFVDLVSKDVADISSVLEADTYHTKTLGERHLAAARPAGEGLYSIIKHKEHTHLVYVLEMPEKLGDVQHSFNIEQEGSFILAVKNPYAAGAFTRSAHPVHYPQRIKDLLGTNKWSPAKDHELLEHEGAELFFAGASDDLHEEFGELGDNLEKQAEAISHKLTTSKIFEELRMHRQGHPIQPLTKGEWK